MGDFKTTISIAELRQRNEASQAAANATKQIEVLVRTIQTDTNEAVVSMERSTTDVVGGALLAENAMGEYTLSSVAVSGGQIFLRTAGHLYAIGKGI